MKYKILPVNEDGFVDMTAKELEDLLEEAYQEGYDRAQIETKKQIEYVPYYPYYPYYDTKKYWYDTPYVWCNTSASTYTYSTNDSETIKAEPNNDSDTWNVNDIWNVSKYTTTVYNPKTPRTFTK